MPKKPSELISEPAATPSTPPAVVPTQAGRAGSIGLLIVLALAGVLAYLAFNRIDWGWGDHKQDDQHQQDDKKHDDKKDKVVAKPGYLLIVRERIDSVEANESVSRVAEFATKQTDLTWRDVDKDDPSEAVKKLIEHAKSKGIDPPFIVFKSKDDNLLRGVIKLPPASATDAQILEVFK